MTRPTAAPSPTADPSPGAVRARPAAGRRLVAALDATVAAAAAAAALATAAGLGARWFPLLDLARHFRLHGLLAMTPGLALALARRRRAAALALGGPWLVSAATVAASWRPDGGGATTSTGAAPEPGADLCLTVFNVWGLNRSPERIGPYLEATGDDLVVVVELRPPLVARLASELPSYAAAALAPRDDFYGVGLYVRRDAARRGVALADAQAGVLVADDALARPFVAARVSFGGREATLLAAHPPPPKGAAMTRQRDRAMAEAVARLARDGRPGILCGDTNAAPASTGRDAARRAGLRDAAAGHGYRGTWPAFVPPWLGIPIDVCLIDPALQATRADVGPALGSDHRPLHVTLRWRAPDGGATARRRRAP